MSYGVGSVLWFVAIVAAIPVALWLFKRSPMGGAAAHGPMRTVATLALAPNQRLVTVEVGSGADRRWLVLGVGPQGIAALHTMAPQADAAVPAEAATPFAQLLARMRR